MSTTFGVHGPAHPRLGRLVRRSVRRLNHAVLARRGFHHRSSALAAELRRSLAEKLASGETLHLLGITPAGHNSGVALVRASAEEGIQLLHNNEEERFSGIKHADSFPERAIAELRGQLASHGLAPRDLHACLAGWDYGDYLAHMVGMMAEHLPRSWKLARADSAGAFNPSHALEALHAPERLGRALGLDEAFPIFGMRHHDNHAALAYALSPFAHDHGSAMVSVLDGFGDDGSISLYCTRQGRLECLYTNRSMLDSLGVLYSILSSTQGGWTPLSSEGRYMGAAAWGDGDRLTNPFYKRLRQLVYFGPRGQVRVNRAMWNVQIAGQLEPYNDELRDVLGDPVGLKEMWNPDAVLDVSDVEHSPVTQERVDKAAATQLLFEDVIFHTIEHLIRRTGSRRLVMTGGTALNCIASMQLLEHFDESWYRRALGRRGRLELWVPPTPGDAGIPAGAAFNFALQAGAPPGPPMRHAFYCGTAPSGDEIRRALDSSEEIGYETLARIEDGASRDRVAGLLASLVADDCVMGLYQGRAETGPRALGHRSILANPCNPRTLEILNARVKLREAIRPLAPMMTERTASRLFELSPGAARNGYAAYDFMVLTARARPEALRVLPAVVHCDGTCRIQIVREDVDPLAYAFLLEMGRRTGVEASVNTSLNVGTPIVQTPAQALGALKRSLGMTGLLLIGEGGEVFVAWHKAVGESKDGGAELLARLRSADRPLPRRDAERLPEAKSR